MLRRNGSTGSGTGASIPVAAAAAVAASAVAAAAVLMYQRYRDRHERAKYIEEEKAAEEDQETITGILDFFRELNIEYGVSIDEANKKRTTKYYELARDAHLYDLVVGVRSYPRLRNRRETEMGRIMKYWNRNNHKGGVGAKSHRTVIVMCDSFTSQLLAQARQFILEPLQYSTDITTEGAWIPQCSVIPESDMHVTVAIPWWWHTIREGNRELSLELVARFRQALVMEFHHSFQIELERIVLLGGRTLVALWRCVGERTVAGNNNNGEDKIIYDRHGDGPDPFVKLRRDIVRCFTSTEIFEGFGKEPLTYSHRYQQGSNGTLCTTPRMTIEVAKIPEDEETTPALPPPSKPERENTIEIKTPGLGGQDGFIHTTLARLPLDCLSNSDIELAPIHRLCREATATYCGHRMVVNQFRFLETTGAGGESNPCVDPIFDAYVDAPPRIQVVNNEILENHSDFSKTVERNATIGALPKAPDRPAADGLFPDAAAITTSDVQVQERTPSA